MTTRRWLRCAALLAFRFCLMVLILAACGSPRTRPAVIVNPSGRTPCVDTPSSDSTVFDTTQVSNKPALASRPGLQYPDELRRQGISGRAVVSVIIEADGSPNQSSVKTVTASYPDFGMAAVQLVRRSRFWPGCRSGQAVRVRMAIPVDFTVKNSLNL